jgi:hypothetical protein
LVVALARWSALLQGETDGDFDQPHGHFCCHGLAP